MTELPLLVQRKYEDRDTDTEPSQVISGMWTSNHGGKSSSPVIMQKKRPHWHRHRSSLPKSPNWYFIQTGVFQVGWAMIYLCGCEKVVLGVSHKAIISYPASTLPPTAIWFFMVVRHTQPRHNPSDVNRIIRGGSP